MFTEQMGGVVMRRYIVAVTVAAIVLLLLTVYPCSAVPNKWLVSVPVQITADTHYVRNPSVLETNNGMWWLFYTRGRDPRGVRGSDGYDPDVDYYDIYYRTAQTPLGLKFAKDQKVPGTYPDNAQRDVSAVQTRDKTIWVFTSTGLGPGTERSVYYYTYDGSKWSGPRAVPGTDYAAHVNAVTNGKSITVFYDIGYNLNVTSYKNNQWSAPVLVATNATIGKGLADNDKLYVVWSHIVESEGIWGDWIGLSVSSDSGHTWKSYDHVMAWPGATNWDPSLIKERKVFSLFFAPDTGPGGQILATASTKTPEDLSSWSAPRQVTTATAGSVSWWDFWPDPVGTEPNTFGVVDLFYSSERNSKGTGMTNSNIWMTWVLRPTLE
jgi:hypothetical protein